MYAWLAGTPAARRATWRVRSGATPAMSRPWPRCFSLASARTRCAGPRARPARGRNLRRGARPRARDADRDPGPDRGTWRLVGRRDRVAASGRRPARAGAGRYLAAVHRRLFERELTEVAVREAEARAGGELL